VLVALRMNGPCPPSRRGETLVLDDRAGVDNGKLVKPDAAWRPTRHVFAGESALLPIDAPSPAATGFVRQ
jgi:hypothetical protein